MSTKLRVLVQTKGQRPLSGARAVRFLYSAVRTRLRNIEMPIGWKEFNTQQTLEFLGQYLPENTKLILIRERKHTRRTRSLYAKMLKMGKPKVDEEYMVEIADIPVARPMNPNVQYPWIGGDAIFNAGNPPDNPARGI